MKLTTPLGVALLLLLGGAARGQAPADVLAMRDGPEYQAAVKSGRAEADAELMAGRATIYAYGHRSLFEHLDRATGLPYRVIAGCVVDDEILGRAAGHNDRIAESIREQGLPGTSLRRWDHELFDLKGYFESRARDEPPHRLTPGGPPIKSPQGNDTIRPVQAQLKRDDGKPAPILGVVVAGALEQEPEIVLWDKGATDLVWGPPGSGFAVLRCRGGDEPRYLALDLRSGRWLREE